jgi:hypothetical protein
MKKNLFVEPELEIAKFSIVDSALFLSDVTLGEDELDPAYGISAYGE